MSAWDIVLPHRLLVNRSLRKASANLLSRIDEYKTEFEMEIERCTAEIEQAHADKDSDFEKAKLSLIDELSKDADLFATVRTELLEYVDLFLHRQCLYKIQDVKWLEKQALVEYSDFLTENMSLIGEEIDILEARKDKLVVQAKVEDIKELVSLTGCKIAVNGGDDAKSLLEKIRELFDSCDSSDWLKKHALNKLRSVLQERVDLFPIIQYISWTIQQKIQSRRQLSGERRGIADEIKDKTNEIKETRKSINTLNKSLDEQARIVREYWAIPITQLNIQLCYLYKKKQAAYEEYEEISDSIERIKSTQSSDSSWDDLWSTKIELRESVIPKIKKEIASMNDDLKQWEAKRKMLYLSRDALKCEHIALKRQNKI